MNDKEWFFCYVCYEKGFIVVFRVMYIIFYFFYYEIRLDKKN